MSDTGTYLPDGGLVKDPSATEEIGVDFSDSLVDNRLNAGAIVGHDVLVPDGLILWSSTRIGARVYARLAGGDLGAVYHVQFVLRVTDPNGGLTPLTFARTRKVRVEAL